MLDRDEADALLDEAMGLLQRSAAAAIASEPLLSTPFANRPELSPWSRTWEPLANRQADLASRIRARAASLTERSESDG